MANEKTTLVDELKALMQQLAEEGENKVMEVKDQVEQLKNQFYRLYHQELEIAKKMAEEAAQAAGETLENWQPAIDEAEQQFRQLLADYKAKRAEVTKQMEADMEQNLLRKENILAQMKDMAEAETADVMDNIQKMRDLQAEWKTIGQVPPQKNQEVWKKYQQYQEQFYDLVKINKELRDLDFKKNLEMKTLLCEAAERLKDNPNIVEASRALQQLHDEWAEIGPVARELREDLWARFKEASSVVNKLHQEYFDKLHAKEAENLQKKQDVIARLKEIDFASFNTNRQWDEAAEKVQQLQNEWRSIGFAPKKHNQTIFEEYRAICDEFFKAKTAFYKGLRDELSNNMRLKKQLIEKAEALRESTAWKETTEAFVELQKEWKTVGPVARKYSDQLWNQFTAACDEFFNRKREVVKENKAESRKAKMEKTIEGGNRNKLMRAYENLLQEISTAENNILFFTGKSKSANQLVDSMQKKIDSLKEQLKELEDKINAMDAE